jgi:hypothetical protein
MKQSKRNQHNQPRQDQKDKLNSYARFSGIAIQMFVIIGLGTFIGVSLTLGSVVMSIIYVIRRIIVASKDNL